MFGSGITAGLDCPWPWFGRTKTNVGLLARNIGSLVRVGLWGQAGLGSSPHSRLNSGHVISLLPSSVRWGRISTCLTELLRELNEIKCLQLQGPLGIQTPLRINSSRVSQRGEVGWDSVLSPICSRDSVLLEKHH